MSKLTPADRIAIVAAYKAGKTKGDLAIEYSVSPATIKDLVAGLASARLKAIADDPVRKLRQFWNKRQAALARQGLPPYSDPDTVFEQWMNTDEAQRMLNPPTSPG